MTKANLKKREKLMSSNILRIAHLQRGTSIHISHRNSQSDYTLISEKEPRARGTCGLASSTNHNPVIETNYLPIYSAIIFITEFLIMILQVR